MGVEIIERSTKYFNQFKNDPDFTANLLEFTNNFTGMVMENVKLVKEIEVSWFSKSSTTSSTWTVNHTDGTIFSTGGDFRKDGFAVGDTFLYEDLSVPAGVNFHGQITSISTTAIYFTLLAGSRTNVDTNAMIRGTTDLSAMNYRFGLIENAESFNVASKVSGNDQGYYGSQIGERLVPLGPRQTNLVTFQKLNQYCDWQTGSFKVAFVSDTYNPLSAQVGAQLFRIEHVFTVVPFYVDGELVNLQTDVVPNLFAGLNTLKYAYSPGFMTVASNPNTEKKIEVDNELGSVAWYNENFNGFNNNYQVNSVDYEEETTGNPADGILITSKTKVTLVVEKNNGNFVAAERGAVYISYLPDQAEYTDTVLTDLKENFLYDNAVNNGGLAANNGLEGIITDFEITNVVLNTMTFTFNVEYSLAQQLRLATLNSQSPRYFVVGVQLGDVTISAGNSDRVVILADVETYDESADIPGLWSFPKMNILTHEKEVGVDVGTTDVTAWNEDDLLVDLTMELNLNKDAVLNSLDFMVVAFDPITSNYFIIDKYSYNIFPATISSGVQQLILNTTRGYILLSGDQFNDVTLDVGANAAGFQQYDGVISQKVSWQEWVSNLNVDTVFFDSLEPQNNLNNKTSNYSFLNGYEIRLAFLGNLSGTSDLGISGLTNYLITTPALTVYNYEEDGGANIWSHTIETFDSTGTNNLGGAILTGQDTLFRTTWSNSGGAVTSLVGLWGINRIEQTGQIGYAITEMSSLNDPDTNQLLKAKSGFTLLDMYLSSGDVVLECLIDGSIAQSGINYNLSSRIQDDNIVSVSGKITEDGKDKATETNILKIVE